MYPFEDDAAFFLNGERLVNVSRYSIKRSICEQPSTFSITLGSGGYSRELMARFKPLSEIEFRIGNAKVFTGTLEDPVSTDPENGTTLTIQGRDNIRKLTKSYVVDERSFGSPTYFDLTKEVMTLAGMDPKMLVAGNDANRKAITKLKSTAAPKRWMIESLETGLVSGSGAKIKYESVVGKVGQSWWDFLVAQYKKCGLYLWCAGDGSLVLSKPDWDMEPTFELKRYRGISRSQGTILSHSFSNRTSSRHKWVRCYGKVKPSKKGQYNVYGDWHDHEMAEMGFPDSDCLVLHNDEARTEEQCAYIAKRQIAEERRKNRTLVYTVYGHKAASLLEAGKEGVYAPDIMVRVNDDELSYPKDYAAGIHEDMYAETVELVGDESNGRTAILHLMRKIDLLYFGEDPKSEGKVPYKLT